MTTSLRHVLAYLIQNCPLELSDGLNLGIKKRKGSPESVDDWLDNVYGQGYRVKYGRIRQEIAAVAGTHATPPKIWKLAAKLEVFVRHLGLDLSDIVEIDPLLKPWSDIPQPFVCVCAIGERTVNTQLGGQTDQRAIGVRDATAVADVIRFFGGHPHLRCRVELRTIERGGGERFLEEMEKRTDVKVIVAVGSDAVNPATDVLVRHVFADRPDAELPVRFVWPSGVRPGLLSCNSSPQGIRYCSDPDKWLDKFLERETDDQIAEKIKEYRSPGHRRGEPPTFSDCGMFLMRLFPAAHDARKRKRAGKLLVVIAGHGGCGTMAAASLLHDEITVHQWIEEAIWGIGCAWKLVKVTRVLPPHVYKRDEKEPALDLADVQRQSPPAKRGTDIVCEVIDLRPFGRK